MFKIRYIINAFFLLIQVIFFAVTAQPAARPEQADGAKSNLPSSLQRAKAAYDARQFDKAIQYCTSSLRLPAVNGNHEAKVFAHNLLGSCYTKTRHYTLALQHLKEGRFLAQKYLADGHTLTGDTHFYLGVYYDMLAKGDTSVYHHQKALDIRLRHFGESHQSVAESLMGLGEVYMITFKDNKKAALYFQQSAAILEANGAPESFQAYAVYYNLGNLFRLQEDSDRALSYAFKALGVVNANKNLSTRIEKCYVQLGDIYYGTTDYQAAMEYYKRAMEESVSANGPYNFNLIETFARLGLLYGEMEQYPLAIASLKKSNAIAARQSHPNADLVADNFLHLGRMYQKTGMFDSARYFFHRCLRAQQSVYGERHAETSEAYSYLAGFYQELDLHDSSAYYIQKSLDAALGKDASGSLYKNPRLEILKDRQELFELFAEKGAILLDRYVANPSGLQDLTMALSCMKVADTLMEINRNAYRHEGSKLFFADHYHHIYETALQVTALLYERTQDLRYFADALTFMEKSKSLLLAESLHKAELQVQAGLPDSVRSLERTLNSALAAYQTMLEGEAGQTPAGQQRIREQMLMIGRKQQQLLDSIALHFPNYFQHKYQTLSTLEDIRSLAIKKGATILEYFWGEEHIFMLAVSGPSLVLKSIPATDTLSGDVLAYFQMLHKTPQWDADHVKDFGACAHRIYQTLVAPLLRPLSPKKLIIVRDGPLLMIPFESLVVTNPEAPQNFQELDYVIRHHPVSYAHAGDILVKHMSRTRETPDEHQMLAFSYSRVQDDGPGNALRASRELPGAAQELQAISEILPGQFYAGPQATESRFKQLAGNFDILHLAVHGRADPDKKFSGSLFFPPGDDSDDGELHIYELYDMALKARLTVLSACESGVGKRYRGEGVFSIARAFDYAGCPSTVMTLWPVNDFTSAGLMTDFYRGLSRGENIDDALRHSKLNYLKTADHNLAHPNYWAAYIPTGSMDRVFRPSWLTRTRWIFVAVVLIVGALLFLRRQVPSRPA